ncbi:hypothetical protein QJQ45_004723 [Haematococcus lacustris]|nr:hypothetical protein QJQ45_004723 [Haematococcus lacustris]
MSRVNQASGLSIMLAHPRPVCAAPDGALYTDNVVCTEVFDALPAADTDKKWPVNAMVTKKRGVMARCAGAQKAREVMAQRRAAEAEAKAQAGAAEAETQAQADAGAYEADEAGADEAGAYEADAGAYEAEAQAQADARAYEAQLHQLQPELPGAGQR